MMLIKDNRHAQGFTLIEVLLALAIIALSLTALLKASAQNVANTHRIKEKTVSHWVAMQGVEMIQLGLLPINLSHLTTQATTLLGEKWYWRVKAVNTPMKFVQKIIITVSKNQSGPFGDPLTAFRYERES